MRRSVRFSGQCILPVSTAQTSFGSCLTKNVTLARARRVSCLQTLVDRLHRYGTRAPHGGDWMKRYWLLLLWLPLLAVGCSSRVHVKYDSTVSADEQQLMESDFDKIASLNIPDNQSSGEASLLGISGFSGSSISSWIGARTKYIAGDNYSTDSSVVAIASGVAYTPQLFNEVGFRALSDAFRITTGINSGRLSDDSSSTVQTVMTNIGAAVYLQGKQNSIIYAMQVAGDQVTDNTPMIGVVQIGPGLFQSKTLPDSPPDSLANACLRGSTYVHEDGHTRGNGTNAGMPHAQCTTGTYSGYYACENNLNGPYVLGRVFLTQCYYACAQSGCTPEELDEITTFIADLASRLLPTAQMADPTAEEVNL